MATFNWLHLTDLHLGMEEQDSLLPAIRDSFFEDIKSLHDRSGPWDLVLFTGDLAQSGSAEQFQKVEAFLGELWKRLGKLGSDPFLLAIPGNHDLVRPDENSPDVISLGEWPVKAKISKQFWGNKDWSPRNTVKQAFLPYSEWWEKTRIKKLPITAGLLPGDFSAVLEKDGATLGIVGLNSTFLQLAGGDFQNKLALSAGQFQTVCGGDGPAWTRNHNACLLLTHQPPDWLTKDALEDLRGEILPYFQLHLFGHMHEARYRVSAEGGAAPERTFQGYSLFGVEYTGQDGQKRQRLHGYAAGRVELQGNQGSIVFWPRLAGRPGKAGWHFSPAPGDEFLLSDERTAPQTFRLQKPVPVPVPPQSTDSVAPSTPPSGSRKRWAVIVGIDEYQAFTKLHYCRNDATELAEQLRDPLRFDEVVVMPDATRKQVFDQLGDMQGPKIGPDDLLLFFFSGHGLNIGGKDYLLPVDAAPKTAKTNGIKMDDLVTSLEDTGCKNIVMLIDACREQPAAGGKGTPSVGEESCEVIANAGIVAFFSCDPRELSYEIDDLKHGSFTYCILEAIREGTGATAASLGDYLKLKVPQVNDKYQKPPQQPYPIIQPKDRGNLEVLRNPSALVQGIDKFDRLSGSLYTLYVDNKISKDIFYSILEFLERAKAKEQLDASERKKLEMIQDLCGDTLPMQRFILAWNAAEKARQFSGPTLTLLMGTKPRSSLI